MKFCFHSFILKVMSCRSSPSPTPLNVFIKFRFPNSTLGEIPTITSTLGECLHEVPLRKFRLGIMSSQSSFSTIPLLVVCHSKVSLCPHFTKDYFGPKSTKSIFLVDRQHICETIGDLRAITDNHLGRSGKVWKGLAQSHQSYESLVPKK